MLEVKNNNIYLTKGDTGKLNITVSIDSSIDSSSTKYLKFTVRNAQNLDNEMFFLTSEEANTNGAITSEGNTWTVHINKAATAELKRKKYVYDIALEIGEEKYTFVGGGTSKTEFWVT